MNSNSRPRHFKLENKPTWSTKVVPANVVKGGYNTNNITNNTNSPIYVNVEVNQDPLGQVVNTIKTFSGGSKNAYNYGG